MAGVKADLHIHSTVSDGSMSPEEIVSAADQLQLKTIALTDHDTIEGIETARRAADGTDLNLINGVEITTAFADREIHLLAYAFNRSDSGLNEYLQDHNQARFKRAKVIVRRLNKKGLNLTIDEVYAEANTKNICRPHIASVLISKGYVASHKEAFIRYLNDEAIGKMEVFYHTIQDVVETVKQAGGIAVIAHPGRMFDTKELEEIIATGIDGIEAVHPSHSYKIQKELEKLAKRHNLLVTGGSDFHGKTKEYYRHFGTLGITSRKVGKIKRLAAYRKKSNSFV